MGSKILRKVAMQLQAGAAYEGSAMALMAFTDGIINQGFDPIEDEGIIGVGFNNTPLQGPRHVTGNYSFNYDPLTIPPLLEASLGRRATTAYDFNGSHAIKLSIAELNALQSILYNTCYPKSLKISGSKGALIKVDTELFSVAAQTRGVAGNFPIPTVNPTVPLSFHEMGGATGYFRIADQVDALATGDRIKVDSFDIDITTGFDEQFANENDYSTPDALGSLIPLWGMVQPGVKFTFKIPRYSVSTYQTWQDNSTLLQAELYIYKSATANVKIQIPNFKIKVNLESGDLTSLSVEAIVGRNGIGSSYTNTFMAFNSPIKFTNVNS